MKSSRKLTSTVSVVLTAMLVLAGCSKGTDSNASGTGGSGALSGKTIKIGVIGPMSGNNADKGKRMLDGIRLAVDEVNQKGGILGGTIDLVVEDDEGVPAKSVNAVTKLVNSDKVVSVVGSVPSSATIAAMQVTNKAGIPHIAANSSSPKITELGYKYAFRTIPSDAIQAAGLAKFAIEDRKFKTIAIIHAADDYGVGGKNAFQATAKDLGVNIATIEQYNPGDKEFTSQLLKIKATNPDALVVWGLQTEAALIVKQARQQGINAQILGAGGIPGKPYVDLGGTAVEGTMVTITFMPDRNDPTIKAFLDKFEAKYKYEPDLTSAQPYDAVGALAKAIETAASLDPDKIQAALAQTKGYKGVTGEITFNDKRDVPTKRVFIAQLKNGKWELVK